MATSTTIEWTGVTWNPCKGCTVISPGCTHCYAMRMAHRLSAMGQGNYLGTTRKSGRRVVWTGKVALDWAAVDAPRIWQSPKLVFVNSMSDLFHENVPFEFIQRVFKTMVETPRHTYQVLTKRSPRLAALANQLPWPANVWMGVSVENADYLWRIDCLRQVPAATKFLSLEPLLGPLDELNLAGIDWVIVGGESGPGARPMEEDWVRSIRSKCESRDVPFFFKQWGGSNKKRAGRVLDGRTWDGMPAQNRNGRAA